MEKHVYLNGELQATTTKPRESVIQQMSQLYGATLFRECVIRIPKNQDRYLKMRFTAPADIAAERSRLRGSQADRMPVGDNVAIAQGAAVAQEVRASLKSPTPGRLTSAERSVRAGARRGTRQALGLRRSTEREPDA